MEYESVAIMNQVYGQPGRIVFRYGPMGFPVAVLVSPAGTCEVSLYGAQVLNYRPLGHQQVLYTSPDAEFVEGKAIRGGIPICWPWFGPAQVSGLPPEAGAHGFARRSPWIILKTEFTQDDTILVLGLTNNIASEAAFDHPYLLKATFTLGACLQIELQTRNMSEAPFTFSECLHAYLRVADGLRCELFGVNGVSYIDPPDESVKTQDGPLHIDDGIDRIYHATKPEEGGSGVALQDPIMGRNILIVAEDTSGLVVWEPSSQASFADLPKEDHTHFICVEPTNPAHPTFTPITLAPGESHYTTLRIQAEFIKHE